MNYVPIVSMCLRNNVLKKQPCCPKQQGCNKYINLIIALKTQSHRKATNTRHIDSCRTT